MFYTWRNINALQEKCNTDIANGKELSALMLIDEEVLKREGNGTSCILRFQNQVRLTISLAFQENMQLGDVYWVGKVLATYQNLTVATFDHKDTWYLF